MVLEGAGVTVKPRACMQEVLGSNLSRDAIFLGFLSAWQQIQG